MPPPPHPGVASGVDLVLQAAIQQGILRQSLTSEEDDRALAFFYDLDALERQYDDPVDGLPGFAIGAGLAAPAAATDDDDASASALPPHPPAVGGPQILHAVACKSNPLLTMLRSNAARDGLGCECASINEVRLALRAGFPPERVVFDSPCKTVAELRLALTEGVQINADNLHELGRIERMRADSPSLQASTSRIGLRLNPLVGAGSVASMSVSTAGSKFGVPVCADEVSSSRSIGDDDGVLTPEQFVAQFRRCPFLSCVHVHVGSKGCGLTLLAKGVARAVDLALRVNASLGRRQVTSIDIGGGLPRSKTSDTPTPTFAAYGAALRRAAPALFAPGNFDLIITEFGRALTQKSGWCASRVEYVKKGPGKSIAVIHAGADVFLRNCYAPQNFASAVSVYGAKGTFRGGDARGKDEVEAEEEKVGAGAASKKTPAFVHDIAGPMCFAGDIPVRGVALPVQIGEGDYVVVHDTGCNTLSLFSHHCSRARPPVYGYRHWWEDQQGGRAVGRGDDDDDDDDEMLGEAEKRRRRRQLVVLNKGQTSEDVMRFWGC